MTPLPPPIPGGKCTRRVGFLFPHPCDRVSPIGCPDCQNGQVEDPYRNYNRYGYSQYYDDYDDAYYGYYGGYYGLGGFGMGHHSYSDPNYIASQGVASDVTGADFTEADGQDMVKPDDQFENDMTGS